MSPIALFLTSLSLSTDAFAAALARGSAERQPHLATALRVGAVFGLAEGLMCLAGWTLALVMASLIIAVDHWIALVLLGVIGGRMVLNGWREDGEDEADGAAARRSVLSTVITAIGTSIDSAAVGVAIALAGGPVWSALLIGVTSFALSTLGYLIGPRLGVRFGGYAEIAGGLVLIGLGVSIFVSHTLAG